MPSSPVAGSLASNSTRMSSSPAVLCCSFGALARARPDSGGASADEQ